MAQRTPRAEVELWHASHSALLPATVPPGGRELAAYRRAQVAQLARRAQERRRAIAAVGSGPGLLAAGEIAHAVPYGLPAALAAGSVPLATLGWRRLRDLRRAREAGTEPAPLSRWERASLAVRGGVATWLPTAAAVGAWGPLPMRDAVLIGWPVAAGAYLWRNRRQDVPVVPEAIPDPVLVWSDLIGGPQGALSGSHLAGLVQEEDGSWSATVELVRGRQTWKDLVGAMGKVSSAYDTSAEQIIIEPVRGRPAAARISVHRQMPLLEAPQWDPAVHVIDPATGTAPMVAFPDGTLGYWRWWHATEDSGASGAVHGLTCGTTGAGKSRLLALKLSYERRSPLMVSWVADPQNGQSLPHWTRSVDWYARSMEEIRVLLYAVQGLMDDRSARIMAAFEADPVNAMDPEHFVPTPDMPLLNVIIDEAHRVLSPNDGDMAKVVSDMSRQLRKTGISLTLATQMPTLADLGEQALKGMLLGGNSMILRTGERVSGDMMAAQQLPGNPYELPKEIILEDGTKKATGGLGYLQAGSAPPTLCRVLDVGRRADQQRWAREGETTALGPADQEFLSRFLGQAYRIRRDWPRPFIQLKDCPGTRMGPAPARTAETAPRSAERHLSASERPKTRELALKILRGTDGELTSTQIGAKLRTLGVEITDPGVMNMLSRAEQADQVIRLPAAVTGPDRSARWKAAS